MKRLVTICLTVFLLMPLQAQAKGWTELHTLLDQTLQLVKIGEWDKANSILQYFSTEFAAESKKTAPEHVRVISMAYDKAVEAVQNQDVSQQTKEDSLLALRLVLDAETSTYQPMWQARQQQVLAAFAEMEQAVQAGKNEQFQYVLNTFLYEMEIIYPSLVVDLPKEDLNKINTHLSYLDEFRGTMVKREDSLKQLSVIRADLTEMFQQMNKDEMTPSFIWIMITTGSIIIFTLTYVGWRKYKGERARQRQPLNSKYNE